MISMFMFIVYVYEYHRTLKLNARLHTILYTIIASNDVESEDI